MGPGRILNPAAVGNPDETPRVQLSPEAAKLLRAAFGQAPSKNNPTIPACLPEDSVVEVLDQFTDRLGLSIMYADPTSAHDDVTVDLDRLAVEQLHAALGAWLDRS